MSSDAVVLRRYLETYARGKENAKRRRKIAADLRWGWEVGGDDSGIRRVKAAAEELRLEGVPIGYSTDSEDGGLYLCTSPSEIKDVLAKLRRLALSILREYSAVKRALVKAEEAQVQKELF